MSTITKPAIKIVMNQNKLVTTSKNVADNFNKQHKHILRDIEKLLKEDVSNFGPMFYEGKEPDSYGRQQKVYYMNRDGFTFLVMGFTGKQAREFKLKYIEQFNKMEKQLKEPTHSYLVEDPVRRAELWIQEQKQKQQLEQQNTKLLEENADMIPKVEYYDTILRNKGLVTISKIAKNYGYSAKAFNDLLHDLKIQFKQGGTWLLYQSYARKGYTHVEPYQYKDREGKYKTASNTKWTQKGHKFLYDKLKAEGIVPLIERDDDYEA